MKRILPVALLALVGVAVAVLLWQERGARTADANAALIAAEERIQSLAHALIDAQVVAQDGDDESVAHYAAASIEWTGFPARRGATSALRPGFSQLDWEIDELRRIAGTDFAEDLRRFLGSFSEVEDLRLKLGDARLDSTTGKVKGKLKLRVVGRNAAGEREWVRGLGKIEASNSGNSADGWRIERLEMREARSIVAAQDPFVEVGRAAGLDAARVVVDEEQLPTHPGANNGGLAVVDLDGDGFLDVFVTGRARNLLLWNRGGRFEPAADDGVAALSSEAAQVALFVDHDQDGDQDVFLCTWDKRQVLLENRGDAQSPRFIDASEKLGDHPALLGNSLSAADVNGDRRPDVFVGVWSEIDYTPLPGGTDPSNNGRPNLLFVSQPDGTYHEEAERWGLVGARWSHASQFADVDSDGRADLYVANDYSGGNRLYVASDARFVDEATSRGVLDRGWAMGVSFGDVDADGDLDLHVTRMSSTAGARIRGQLEGRTDVRLDVLELVGDGNKIYGNDGAGQFTELSFATGQLSGGWAFGGGFADLDNDGWLDLYTPNGFRSGESMCDT